MMFTELKAEAKGLGLKWSEVRAVYGELRERERLSREWKWEVRGAAFAASGWGRHFKSKYHYAFNGGGDMCDIPGFDELAQEMAWYYPELNVDKDPSRALFDLLAEAIDKMPPAEKTYREALDTLAVEKVERDANLTANVDDCPF